MCVVDIQDMSRNSLQLMSEVVYHESIKRKLKRRPIYECRCDEKLKTKPLLLFCVLLSIMKR
jgi:hypothetical protein